MVPFSEDVREAGEAMTIFVDKIVWERTFFELAYRTDEDAPLFLYRVKERRFVPFETETDGCGGMIARVNVTCVGCREPLSDGEWIISKKLDVSSYSDTQSLLEAKPYLYARMKRDVVRKNKDIADDPNSLSEAILQSGLSGVCEHPYDTHGIRYDASVLEDLNRYSRVFRYGRGTYAYAFMLVPKVNSEGDVYLVLDATFFERNHSPRIRKRSIRFMEKRIFCFVFRLFSRLSRKKGNRVLFLKENGESPTENMAALQRRIVERELDKRFEITSRYRNVFGGRQRLFAWLKDLYLIARSDYIFIDDYTPVFNFIDQGEETVLTQLWHAGVGFKSVGYARFGMKGSPDPYASAHRKYTFALVGNEHLRDIYAEVFGIEKGALLATGMPRLDHFLDADVAEAAKKNLYTRYPWARRGRVILFAPTFRGTGQRGAHYPYELFDMEALYEMCVRTNSYFVFEMHHFITESPTIDEQHADRIFDLSQESLNDLFHIADVLVTDYSSCFYDYILLRKPVVFFVPDKLSYTLIRGVQRSIDKMAPGVLCDTFEEFLDVLEYEKYSIDQISPVSLDRAAEGGMLASDRVINTILLHEDVPGVKFDAHDSQ